MIDLILLVTVAAGFLAINGFLRWCAFQGKTR
jgi:hypothetical protein